MSDKIISRAEGKVALPEAGEGVFLQFTVQAFEQIETAFPDQEDHIAYIMKAMVQMKVSVFAKVLSACLHGSTTAAMPYGLKWEELTDRIMDALCLSIHGRDADEQKAFEQEQMIRQAANRMKGIMDQDPQMAAVLLSTLAGQQESEPGSSQTKSVA